MSKEQVSQVVSSLSGNEAPPPPLTPERKEFSDNRMGMLSRHALRHAGVDISTKPKEGKKDETPSGNTAEGAAPVKETSQPKPVDDKSKTPEPTPKKESEGSKTEVDWTEEARKHQSRADKAEAKLKEMEPQFTERENQIKELGKYKEQVESFVADPVTFMTKYAPSLAQKLAQAGDPIKLVENELSTFMQDLDKQFFTQYGQDWRYNEVESIQPGTASFRYKLAMDDRRNQILSDYRGKIEADRKRMEQAVTQVAEDKKKLATEYGFTDKDFAEADAFFKENKMNYYTLAKAALFDKILAKKLEGVVHSPSPSPEVGDIGTRGEIGSGEKKPKLSEGTRQMLSRLGSRGIR
jgi:hypothetical protein